MRLDYAVLIACVLTGGLSPHAAGQEDSIREAPVRHRDAALSLRDGRLSVRVQNVPLVPLLEEIARQSRLSIVPDDGIRQDLISADLSDVPLDEGLRRLLQSYDTFHYYGVVSNAPSSLQAVWVYAKGRAASLRPVPPNAWAGTAEIEASLTDSNPDVRERAYRVLLDRPFGRSRELILDAVGGVTEQDEAVRQRLLSNVLNRGIALPADMLAELVRGDRSEMIRLMALDGLVTSAAPHGTTKQAAELALADPSDAVRGRAAEVLSELGVLR